MNARDPGSLEAAIMRAYDQAGGPKVVAHQLGRSLSQLYAYGNPAENQAMPLDLAARLAGMGGVALAEHFAALAGGTFRPEEGAADSVAVLQLATEAVREGAEAVAATLEGAADAGEEVDQAIRAFTKLRSRVRRKRAGK